MIATDALILDGQPASIDPRQQLVRMAPRTGAGFFLRGDERLQVIDPLGEQVSDLMAYDAHDLGNALSSGRTIDYANRIYVGTGDTLYSNRSDPLLAIEQDTAGGHDFLLTPCSPEMFAKLYGITDPRPSCFTNLARNLAPFGIAPDTIATTLNLFMNVRPDPDSGELTIGVPHSRAGDSITLRAQRDLIVGLTACSAENSNNGTFKPIDFRIFSADEASTRPARSASPPPQRAAPRPGMLHHIALAARQWEPSIAFYREAFGAEPFLRFSEKGLRVAMLDLGVGCRIELFETRDAVARQSSSEAAEDSSESIPGALIHFAVAVDDVDAMTRRLVQCGARVESEPDQTRLGDEPSAPVASYSFVRGPSGELIELISGRGL